MDARVLQSPFSKSFFLHLLLLVMFAFLIVHGPRLKTKDDPISIQLLDLQKDQGKTIFESDQDRTAKENKSAYPSGMFERKRVISVKDLGVKIPTENATRVERERNWVEDAQGDDVSGGEFVAGLREDETSALNTKEYVFFSYTQRMRNQLYQVWAPIIQREVARFYGMGFTLSDNTMFMTRTRVVINARGKVVKVQLLQESGVLDLDEAAITALNEAGPYPNPPKGLMNEKGIAELNWNFILRN